MKLEKNHVEAGDLDTETQTWYGLTYKGILAVKYRITLLQSTSPLSSLLSFFFFPILEVEPRLYQAGIRLLNCIPNRLILFILN